MTSHLDDAFVGRVAPSAPDLDTPADEPTVTTPVRTRAAALPVRLDDAGLRLIADPLRARIVELLAVESLCTFHLVEMTGARQTNISNHLRVLREAGLVVTEPFGRFTYYVLVPGAVARLAEPLAALVRAAEGAESLRRACT